MFSHLTGILRFRHDFAYIFTLRAKKSELCLNLCNFLNFWSYAFIFTQNLNDIEIRRLRTSFYVKFTRGGGNPSSPPVEVINIVSSFFHIFYQPHRRGGGNFPLLWWI